MSPAKKSCTVVVMSHRRALVLTVVALVVAAMAAGVARAQPRAGAPQPKLMALTVDDLGRGAVVESQRFTTSGPITASRGYQRSFAGVTVGKVPLFTLQDTVLVGKTEAGAAKLVSSILLASSTKAGRNTLYVESEKSFAASSKLTVQGGAVTRAGELTAGDSAVELVFRFNTPKGSFQVGEIFVRVGGNLSAIYYGAGKPGLTRPGARRLALAAARHMREAGTTA
jgi:hypothetical protein